MLSDELAEQMDDHFPNSITSKGSQQEMSVQHQLAYHRIVVEAPKRNRGIYVEPII